MATTPNKKSTIRELMYLAKEQKDKEMMEAFKHYGTSSKRSGEHQGIMFVGPNALGMMHLEFTVNGHDKVIYVGDPHQMSPTIDRIDPKRRYFPPDED